MRKSKGGENVERVNQEFKCRACFELLERDIPWEKNVDKDKGKTGKLGVEDEERRARQGW